MAQPALAPTASAPVLGRYHPLRPLGSGGSGSVWLAHDEVTGLDVALKIVPREGRAAARAEREAEAATRLRHPYCLRSYDLGHDARHVYIVYEYVPGRTLREAMRAGEVDDATAIEAAAQILEGLAHSHARGIVHRDVKPANVILAEGDEVSIRILDFGLALMDHVDTLTASGDVPGTLAYVPPERLAGEDASPASDVWAVGVLLWEALAGGHPFWKSSVLDAAKAIQAGAPSLATVRPDLPRPLTAAVDGALALEPGRRPTAAQLADALRTAARPRRNMARGQSPGQVRIGQLADRWAGVPLTGLGAGLGAAALPFYPGGAAFLLGLAAAAAAALRPRIGLAVALSVLVLPLGNVSLGLAIAYAAAAAAWLALFAGEPRWGALPALGPLLGPLGVLVLAPAAALRLRSPLRRAAAGAGIVVAAAVAAGLRGTPLPLTGEQPPVGLGIAGSEDVGAASGALISALAGRPGIALAAGALAAAAALLPLAAARGRWPVAGLGAALVAVLLLPVPEIAALPVVLGAWALCVPGVLRAPR
ncbi:MAG: serine/threonine protein kinase [Thermoleophilia bacterium]|nr:serine/threonine protein kinase [Thermoleophilia bacterium]